MRRSLALALALVGLVAAAPTAGASIKIHNSETLELLQEFDKASCKASRNAKIPFYAFSLPANDLYTLDVFITRDAWKGFGHTYNLYYGNSDITAYVFGPNQGETYTNEVGLPGTPPGTVGAGAIKISANGKRYSIGAYGLSDESASRGVSVSGAAKCKYKHRPNP